MPNFIKKIFIVFFILLISNAGVVYCANDLASIQKKQKATHEKINNLKYLERVEKSKLSKNQRKLEKASQGLQTSRRQYSNLEAQLSQMEIELARSVNQFNSANKDMHNRMRQVYKHQRNSSAKSCDTIKENSACSIYKRY